MDQRRSIPWLWILVTLGLVVIVGAIAFYLGATHPAAGHPMAFARFGHGALGFWLPVLLLAIVVGVIVAAIARPRRPTMTFDEWHRRAHADRATKVGTTEPGTTSSGRGDEPAEAPGPAQAGEDTRPMS